jgi:isopentenyldiphosphate isomerase
LTNSYIDSTLSKSLSSFVGRKNEQELLYSQFIKSSEKFKIISVQGTGGVGKTTLINKFIRNITKNNELTVCYINENFVNIIELLKHFVVCFAKSGFPLKKFNKLLNRFLSLKTKLEKDENAPTGSIDPIITGIVNVGVRNLYRFAPTIVKPFIPQKMEKEILTLSEEFSKYIFTKIKSKKDRDLLLYPMNKLISTLINELNNCAKKRNILLIFDSYEIIGYYFDVWFKRIVQCTYSDIHENITFIMVSRESLIERYIDLSAEIYEINLDKFSYKETSEFLTNHGIFDKQKIKEIISKTGHLPLTLEFYISTNIPIDLKKVIKYMTGLEEGSKLDLITKASIPRYFNRDILKEILYDVDLIAAFNYLITQGFVELNNRNQKYSIHNVIREYILKQLYSESPIEYSRCHSILLNYYEKRIGQFKNCEINRNIQQKLYQESKIEYYYHLLSSNNSNSVLKFNSYLSKAFSEYLLTLRNAFSYAPLWIEMFKQMSDEIDNENLKRLSQLLKNGWAIIKNDHGYDQSSDIFFSLSAATIQRLSDDVTDWIIYFESRYQILIGNYVKAYKNLLSIWNNPNLEYELRFYAATDLGELNTRQGKIKESIQWNNKAIKIASNRQNHKNLAIAYYQQAINYKRQGKYDKSLKTINSCVKLLKKQNNSNYHIARALFDKGNTLIYLGNFIEAEKAFNKSLKYFKENSKLGYAESLHRIGWMQRLQGYLCDSINSHFSAINILNTINENFFSAKALHSLGNVFIELYAFENALVVYYLAYDIFKKLNANRHAAIVKKDMSIALYINNEVDDAKKYLNESIIELQNSTDFGSLADAKLKLLKIILYENQFDNIDCLLIELEALIDKSENQLLNQEIIFFLTLIHIFNNKLCKAKKILSRFVKNRNNNILAMHSILCININIFSLDMNDCFNIFLKSIPIANNKNKYLFFQIIEYLLFSFKFNIKLKNNYNKFKELLEEELIPSNEFLKLLKEINDHFINNNRIDSIIPKNEFLFVIDEKLNPQKIMSRKDIHKKGMLHKCFHCWIIYKNNNEKYILFQKRGPFKKNFSNKFDISCAGHQISYEGEMLVKRELKEELGIDIQQMNLKKIAKRNINEKYSNGTNNHEIQEIYFLNNYYGYKCFNLNYPEVSGVCYIKIKDLIKLFKVDKINTLSCDGLFYDNESRIFNKKRIKIYKDNFIERAIVYLLKILDLSNKYLDDNNKNISIQETIKKEESLADESIFIEL